MPTITIDAVHDADARCFSITVHAPHQPVFSSFFHYAPGSRIDVVSARRCAVSFLRGTITLHMDAPCLIVNNDL